MYRAIQKDKVYHEPREILFVKINEDNTKKSYLNSYLNSLLKLCKQSETSNERLRALPKNFFES